MTFSNLNSSAKEWDASQPDSAVGQHVAQRHAHTHDGLGLGSGEGDGIALEYDGYEGAYFPGQQGDLYDHTQERKHAEPLGEVDLEDVAARLAELTLCPDELKGIKMLVRVLVGSKSAGGLIGKGGAIIRKFRQDSGAWIDIAESTRGAIKRVVTVQGSIDKINMALKFIADRLADRKRENKRAAASMGGMASNAELDVKNCVTLLVPNAQVGCIIGKGGCQIRNTREISGASIKVSEKLLELSTEKTVTIDGSSEEVDTAVRVITRQLLESRDRSVARILFQPRPVYMDPYMQHHAYVPPDAYYSPYGALPPRYGMYMPHHHHQHLQHQHHQHLGQLSPVHSLSHSHSAQHSPHLSPAMHPMSPPYSHISAPGIDGMNGALDSGDLNGSGIGINGLSPGMPVGAPVGAPHSPSAIGNLAMRGPSQTIVIPVANHMVGSIIGRGGTVIKEIRARSRASVKIGDMQANSTERVITITGSRQSTELAVALVYEKMDGTDFRHNVEQRLEPRIDGLDDRDFELAHNGSDATFADHTNHPPTHFHNHQPGPQEEANPARHPEQEQPSSNQPGAKPATE